ncbi:MAG: CDP-diacylglycerol--serine O-phosphatidyltransferase [Alphaproteobacteria bacterium]|nr:CDP-diacylglycerol--serine O-phosphatidyltransferase [Alphaproteobacteria bacterium]
MIKNPAKKIKDLPFNRIAPNCVTMMALCSGVTAIRFATEAKWEAAVVAILLATIFDALDGRVARMLRGSSEFGAELDSLSDVVCFGVAPGILMYLWTLNVSDKASWLFAMMMPVCCALRLARFNVMLDEAPQPAYWTHFFVGLPAPGGAFVALTPAMLSFAFETDIFKKQWVVGIFLVTSALLMASRLPTISLKHIRIPVKFVTFFFVFVALYIVAMTRWPWQVLSCTFLLYLVTVPVCSIVFCHLKKNFYKIKA